MARENDIFQHFSQEGLKDPRHKNTYEIVFNALEKASTDDLPADFAQKVVRKVEALERKRKRWFYTGMFSGIMVMLGTFIGALVYGFGWEELLRYKNVFYWTVFVGTAIVTIQYLDRHVVKKKNITNDLKTI